MKQKPRKPRSTSADYVSGPELLAEVIACKQKWHASNRPGKKPCDFMSDKLARMLMCMASRYSQKPNFVSYSYRDEMVSDGLMAVMNSWHKFDETRFSNAFAYYTQIIHNGFVHRLNKEKKHAEVNGSLRQKLGLDQSFSRQAERELAP